MADKLESISEQLKRLTERSEGETELQISKPRRGGMRRGAGRKPRRQTLIKGVIDELMEVSTSNGLEMTLTDKSTGKKVTIKEPKVLVLIQGSSK